MERGLVTLIGMSIAYIASLIGLGLAWWAWRRRVVEPDKEGQEPDTGSDGPAGPRQIGEGRGADARRDPPQGAAP